MTKEKFNKIFANLPIGERSNPIYVSSKHGAMSWMVVKLEVDDDTELGKEALNFIEEI